MLLESFEQMGLGLVLLDAQHKVIRHNCMAEIIFSAGDGLSLRLGRITTTCHHGCLPLEMHSPHKTRVAWFNIPRSNNHPDYQLRLIHNVAAYFPEQLVDSILIIIDPVQQRKQACNRVREHFLLTEREMEVCQLLLQGKSTKKISSELGLTYESSRWYVKQICAKLGVSSQTKLVAHILGDMLLTI